MADGEGEASPSDVVKKKTIAKVLHISFSYPPPHSRFSTLPIQNLVRSFSYPPPLTDFPPAIADFPSLPSSIFPPGFSGTVEIDTGSGFLCSKLAQFGHLNWDGGSKMKQMMKIVIMLKEMILLKKMIYDFVDEANFPINRISCRKRQFDEIPNTEREHQSSQEKFRKDYFLALVDLALMQLKMRFEQIQYFESIFGFLFDGSKLVSLLDDELKKCCLELESKLSNVLYLWSYNLVMLPDEAHKGEIPWTSIQIMEFPKKMDMFPNVMIAHKILLTVPVTVASVERSFSKLKLLKSYLRSTMSQERLNGLAIMSIESQLLESLDYHKIIDVFASKNARRHRFR
ncbi:hypothetical protein LXL04_034624 [Taraxacum kok-saghyz]